MVQDAVHDPDLEVRPDAPLGVGSPLKEAYDAMVRALDLAFGFTPRADTPPRQQLYEEFWALFIARCRAEKRYREAEGLILPLVEADKPNPFMHALQIADATIRACGQILNPPIKATPDEQVAGYRRMLPGWDWNDTVRALHRLTVQAAAGQSISLSPMVIDKQTSDVSRTCETSNVVFEPRGSTVPDATREMSAQAQRAFEQARADEADIERSEREREIRQARERVLDELFEEVQKAVTRVGTDINAYWSGIGAALVALWSKLRYEGLDAYLDQFENANAREDDPGLVIAVAICRAAMTGDSARMLEMLREGNRNRAISTRIFTFVQRNGIARRIRELRDQEEIRRSQPTPARNPQAQADAPALADAPQARSGTVSAQTHGSLCQDAGVKGGTAANTANPAPTHAAAKAQAKAPGRPPPSYYFKVYLVAQHLQGTQAEVAKKLTDELFPKKLIPSPLDQGKLSKILKRVKRYLSAGGALPDTAELGNPKQVPMDPSTLDKGKRIDPRKPRPSELD
jgi:hypothetical protein